MSMSSRPDAITSSQPLGAQGFARRVSTLLYAKPRARLALLLAAPLTWLVLIYIASLAALLITALWSVDEYTGAVKMTWSLDNITQVITGALYQAVTLRTVGVALLVTVVDILIALPIAFFMAKVAKQRTQKILVAFGDQIAFEDTLDEALDALFGGDSGANSGSETKPETPGSTSSGTVDAANPALSAALAATQDQRH